MPTRSTSDLRLRTENRYASFVAGFQREHRLLQQDLAQVQPQQAYEHTALMILLRMAFLYFLQQQGLLDNDSHYLSNRLSLLQQHVGDNSFAEFYRYLNLRLLHHPSTHHSPAPPLYVHHLGHIPQLPQLASHENAALSSLPKLPDTTFQRMFTFFDDYQWSLREQDSTDTNQLTPDILNIICANFLQQKPLGAYYTGEDVAMYIAKNTILPCLIQKLQGSYPGMLQPHTAFWHLLQANPNRYIAASLRQQDLLPTETRREYQARQARYQQIKARLYAGEICSLADLVTNNLNINQLALDFFEHNHDERFQQAAYAALTHIAILDPTSGPGIFLLAAYALLEPLYTLCLARLPDTAHANIALLAARAILQHNLHGVDIMPEAVEICRLRLLLKLLATLNSRNECLQLHDIQLQVYVGNALVGNTTTSEHENAPCKEDEHGRRNSPRKEGRYHKRGTASPSMVVASLAGAVPPAKDAPPAAPEPFHWPLRFPQIMQGGGFDVIIGNPPYIEYSQVKHPQRMFEQDKGEVNWGNLYAAVVTRSLDLCHTQHGYVGLIVPLSLCGGQRFKPLRHTLQRQCRNLWLANFSIFPSRLFEDAFQRLTILLAQPTATPPPYSTVSTTRLHRWFAAERPHILPLLTYTNIAHDQNSAVFPKLASPLHDAILAKMSGQSQGHTLGTMLHPQPTAYFVYYQEATNYWTKAVCHTPYYKKNGQMSAPTHGRFLYFRDETSAKAVMALLNSSLFFLWFTTYSDGFHLSHALVKALPVAPGVLDAQQLVQLATQLEADIFQHAQRSTRNTKPGDGLHKRCHQIELAEYRMSYSKPFLDEIDHVLAGHYGFTSEEQDFIINYDIKYRLGQQQGKTTNLCSDM
ncbi:MAG TPA: DNA methyltransferase [Ktedonobacteraceae bacterium]|nr:DNA methyltransferase [Ktedonobacteraceae bacterium]